MIPDNQDQREEELVRDDASRGNTDWLPAYERPGSAIDIDHTWEDE